MRAHSKLPHLHSEVMHQNVLDRGGEGQCESAHAPLPLHDRLQLHAVPEDEFDLQHSTAFVNGLTNPDGSEMDTSLCGRKTMQSLTSQQARTCICKQCIFSVSRHFRCLQYFAFVEKMKAMTFQMQMTGVPGPLCLPATRPAGETVAAGALQSCRAGGARCW